MSKKQNRRHFSAQEKVALLKRHLLEKAAVADLCDEAGIAPSQFYRWQKEFFENGARAFENGRKAKAELDQSQKKIKALEDKLTRKNEVVAELLEEYTQLKKELGEL
jgi:transposase-like protein